MLFILQAVFALILQKGQKNFKTAFQTRFFRGWRIPSKEDLALSVGDYLWSAVPGMTKELWEELEREAVSKGIFSKGGYMNIREYIKEEGRQEGIQKGRQEGRQQVVLNMLQKRLDTSLISEVTGLSEEEIKKLQNGS